MMCLILSVCFPCSLLARSYHTLKPITWQTEKLNGKVKTIKTQKYLFERGTLTLVEDPWLGQQQFNFDQQGRLTSYMDEEDGREEGEFYYNQQGQILKHTAETKWVNCTKTYTYLPEGYEIENSNKSGITPQIYRYDKRGRLIEEVYSLRMRTLYSYDEVNHSTTSSTYRADRLSSRSYYTYDPMGRLLSRDSYYDYKQSDSLSGTQERYRYNEKGQLIEYYSFICGKPEVWERYKYNANGLLEAKDEYRYSFEHAIPVEEYSPKENFPYKVFEHKSKKHNRYRYEYKYDHKGNWVSQLCFIMWHNQKREVGSGGIKRQIEYYPTIRSIKSDSYSIWEVPFRPNRSAWTDGSKKVFNEKELLVDYAYGTECQSDEEQYQYNQRGQIIKLTGYANFGGKYSKDYTYDKDGRPTEVVEFKFGKTYREHHYYDSKPDEPKPSKYDDYYYYDSKGRKIKYLTWLDNEERKTIYKYDDTKGTEEELYYTNGSLQHKTLTIKDKEGKVLEIDRYHKGEKFPHTRWRYRYNEQGLQVEAYQIENNTLIEREQTEYNDKGLLLKKKNYQYKSSDTQTSVTPTSDFPYEAFQKARIVEKTSYRYEYTYDKAGNWTLQIVYKTRNNSKEEPNSATQRKIEYYPQYSPKGIRK